MSGYLPISLFACWTPLFFFPSIPSMIPPLLVPLFCSFSVLLPPLPAILPPFRFPLLSIFLHSAYYFFFPSPLPASLSLLSTLQFLYSSYCLLSSFCLFPILTDLLSLLSLISCMHRSSCLQGNQTVGVFSTADVLDGWEDEWKRLKVGNAQAGCLEERGQPTPVCFKSETWQSSFF